jgi:membrane protease YdiL (CAAX protease family)
VPLSTNSIFQPGPPANPRSSYGIAALASLYILVIIIFELITSLHTSWLGSKHLVDYGLYDSPLAVLLVVGVAFWRRPKLFFLSRWIPRLTDFAICIPCGVLIAIVKMWLFSNADERLGPSYSVEHALLPVVLIAPVAEELLFRGIFLRSLEERMTIPLAILVVTLLAAIEHSWFWLALPSQLALSIVYVYLGNSLPASIIVHITMNACIFLDIERLFRH